MALEFTDENFDSLALKSDKVVLVDFWQSGVDLVVWLVLMWML